MEKIYTFTVDKSDDNLKTIEYYVNGETDKLCINVDFPENLSYIGCIVVLDEQGNIRLQKLLRYRAESILIGKSPMDTTIGGVPGNINNGLWKVNIYLFTSYFERYLDENSFEIEVEIVGNIGNPTDAIGNTTWVSGEEGLNISSDKFNYNKVYNEESRWYKGDFHTHTILSDGKETVEGAMKNARAMNLDFYIPTEHNLMHTGWVETDTMIVPGIEVTTDDGHLNIFDVKSMPEIILNMKPGIELKESRTDEKLNIENEMIKSIKSAREQDSIVSINHPFLTVWKWKYNNVELNDINCIEIVNDPTYTYAKESNERAIELIDLLWQDGHRIYGVGGSDSHNLIDERYEGAIDPSIIGDPGTFVYCKGLTPKKLMESVKNGNILVSRYCSIIPEITCCNTDYLPGDEVKVKGNGRVKYKVEILDLKEKPVVYSVINNIKTVLDVQVVGDRYIAETEVEFNKDTYSWMRIDVRKENGEFLGYINPIYSGAKESKYRSFGDILEIMGDSNEN